MYSRTIHDHLSRQFKIICLDKLCKFKHIKPYFLSRQTWKLLTDYTVFSGEGCINLSRLSMRESCRSRRNIHPCTCTSCAQLSQFCVFLICLVIHIFLKIWPQHLQWHAFSSSASLSAIIFHIRSHSSHRSKWRRKKQFTVQGSQIM